MAGAQASELAITVARGGGLGAIPCALLSPDDVREHVQHVRAATKHLSAPINLNFFCHTLPPANPEADKQWQDVQIRITKIKELKPEVVSFYFELPPTHMLNSLVDFPQQIGTMSPVPQIVDAVKLPVMAAGGIGDARGVLAASALGAAAVQMGTVFLLADETKTSALHRKRLKEAASGGDAAETAITNVFSGRPARGFVTRVMHELGPMSVAAGAPLGALKKAAVAKGIQLVHLCGRMVP
ncbi:hypothetical protein PC115_g22136 [Phytophthora cactorum]|uniref:Nitronate monooxygenase domain-containing protein n=1 Tax=Phytophthora cactorum TaxID=29920 RepID=A0A8T1AKT7_9STRA|nr:hypothetical protein PC115_g22136 [Phytophthora cactorum]KAG3052975.1 hypothetical protein PC122_g22476 [Phytophthora cactorum]KAG3127930.1 hypothetical protein C6341_g24777 [Phytophthora cactorum]